MDVLHCFLIWKRYFSVWFIFRITFVLNEECLWTQLLILEDMMIILWKNGENYLDKWKGKQLRRAQIREIN